MQCFLYEIRFPNNKKYIGITGNTKKRFNDHWKAAEGDSALPVHCAIRVFDRVEIVVVACGTRAEMAALEIAEIARQNTRIPNGYNVTFGGDISPMHSPECRARLSATLKGRPLSEAQKRWRESTRGVPLTKEHRKKLSESHKGKPHTEKQKAAQSTPEAIALRSAISKAMWTEDRRSEFSANQKGKPKSEAHRQAIGAASKRTAFTPARVAQLAAARENQKNVDQVAKGKKITATKLARNAARRAAAKVLLHD